MMPLYLPVPSAFHRSVAKLGRCFLPTTTTSKYWPALESAAWRKSMFFCLRVGGTHREGGGQPRPWPNSTERRERVHIAQAEEISWCFACVLTCS
jgi:hypothetical protein